MCNRLLVWQTDREGTRSAAGDPLHGLETGYPMIDMRRRELRHAARQCGGVAPAMLVSASDGVSTCLPKLAWGSLG